MIKEYPIEPVPAPRQVRSDKWRPRPGVKRYRAFRDAVRLASVTVPESGATVTFVLPMPVSWSLKKRRAMDGQPHRQTPDWDNLAKALLDAIYSDDAGVSDITIRKRWGKHGAIIVETAE